MADATQAVAAGADVRLQNRLDPAAQSQIGVADDPGADPRLAVESARTHGGDAVDELGFADRPHLYRAGAAVHRAGLHEHRRDDVVTAAGVGQQFIEEVTPARPVPQMVVRIDDRQVGLDWRTGR
jgi:hypothetical protein